MKCIVTTIRKKSAAAEDLARKSASILKAPYIARDGMSIDALRRLYGIDTIIVAAQNQLIASTSNGDYFFHLSMAELRIKKLLNNENDHMISAMNLQAGQSVLDCTLGMGTDAIVASYVTGNKGRVVGIEASPIISLITSWGLQNFIDPDVSSEILAALRPIIVRQADSFAYLKSMPNDSFDVVYFDPMFRRPVANSITLKPLRDFANKEPLNTEVLAEACRVASRRVVVKEMNGSLEFKRLGISYTTGGKYSSIQYGVIHTGGTAWKN